jgi:hypothetical protein
VTRRRARIIWTIAALIYVAATGSTARADEVERYAPSSATARLAPMDQFPALRRGL